MKYTEFILSLSSSGVLIWGKFGGKIPQNTEGHGTSYKTLQKDLK